MKGYPFACIWLMIATVLFYLYFSKGRDRKCLLLAFYSVFRGAWLIANELLPVDLMSGVYGWIFRGVSAAVLVVIGIWYYRSFKKGQ